MSRHPPARVAPADRGAADNSGSYTRTAVLLHWLIAVLIAIGFAVGATMIDLPLSPQKAKVFAYHKWIGITVLALAGVRVAWRATHAAPRELPMPGWQQFAARVTHALLYVLIMAIPLVGWMYTSAAGFPVVYLKLWQLPDLVSKNRELAETLKAAHKSLAWGLSCVVALHVVAALKHHFIDRDATLKRMLAWRSSQGNRK
ncbi:cytochrome b [Burkholderia sp. MR1-5-21]